MPQNFFVSEHPLVQHKLAHMRKRPDDCPSREFVRLMREIGMLMAYEATKDLEPETKEVDTERVGKIPVTGFVKRKPVIVPVLRAGLVLAEGIKEVIPTTFTGHIGIHNEHAGGSALTYMVALPSVKAERKFILVDPAVATGVTICRAIKILKDLKIPDDDIRLISIVVSREGSERIVEENEGKIRVYCAAIDESVVDGKIIPGIGSVSERLYRTS